MLIHPKIVAIDDNKSHLDALMQGLQEFRIPAHPILYQRDDVTPHEPIGHVRIIFSDLHLLGSDEQNKKKHFGVIETLLGELISAENGPYVLILWTRFPGQAKELLAHLEERLVARKRPVTVMPINKKTYIRAQGTFKNFDGFKEHLSKSINQNPQVAALIDWEMRVLTAAGVAIASVDALVPDDKRSEKEYSAHLELLLGQLASAAIGLHHVEGDKLGAIDLALSPILNDSLIHLNKSKKQFSIWKNAYKVPGRKPKLSPETRASLNRMVHVSNAVENYGHKDRGIVLRLDWKDEKIKTEFGYEKTEIFKYYKVKQESFDDLKIKLVMVQVQPPCDYANRDQKFLPYALGVAVKDNNLSTAPQKGAVWKSPEIELNGEVYRVLVSADFLTRYSWTKLVRTPRWFRFREEILNDLSYSFSNHLGRPGIYAFQS